MIDFDGTNDRVNCTSNASVDNIFAGGGSIMAWINPASFGETGFGRVMDKGTAGASTWNLAVQSSGTNLQWNHDTTGTIGRWTTPTGSIVLDTLVHVAISYDKDSVANDPLMWIDGVQPTVTEQSTPTGTASDDSGSTWAIGNRGLADNRTFDGLIGDCRAYSRIMTDEEVSTIFISRGHDGIVDGLISRWPLVQLAPGATASTDMQDWGNNDNPATPVNSPVFNEFFNSYRKRA